MKAIAVNGRTVGLAGAIFVAAVGMTWAIARVTTHSHISSLREQIAACEQRASARLAEFARATNAASAATKREIARVQELKDKNEQLRQANEKQKRELASAAAGGSPSDALRFSHQPPAPPLQTLELSPGDKRDLIPGKLDLLVEALGPASAEVWFGGYRRHLNVGQSVSISYLGRPCILGLMKIQGGRETQKAFFSFSVMKSTRWVGELAAPAEGPSE
jgi:hypothetical protein